MKDSNPKLYGTYNYIPSLAIRKLYTQVFCLITELEVNFVPPLFLHHQRHRAAVNQRPELVTS